MELIFLDLVRARATVARDGAWTDADGVTGAPEVAAGQRGWRANGARGGGGARFGVGARGGIGGGICRARDARVGERVRWTRARCGGVGGRRGLRVLGLGAREGVGRRGKDIDCAARVGVFVCGVRVY